MATIDQHAATDVCVVAIPISVAVPVSTPAVTGDSVVLILVAVAVAVATLVVNGFCVVAILVAVAVAVPAAILVVNGVGVRAILVVVMRVVQYTQLWSTFIIFWYLSINWYWFLLTMIDFYRISELLTCNVLIIFSSLYKSETCLHLCMFAGSAVRWLYWKYVWTPCVLALH